MNRLFNNGLSEKLLANADRLKIDLWKGEAGVVASFEISGSSGRLDDDGEVEQAGDLAFVAELIAQFRKGGTK